MSAFPTDGIAASRVWRAPDAVHIDVRGLPPPEPAVAILQFIEQQDAGQVVIAHLDREPIFLYPELSDRGWTYEILASECGKADCEHEVLLRLIRLAA